MNKLINFIKYHNAFAIAISLVFILMVGALASEDVRDAVIGEEIVIKQGIDNSAVLAANLDNFELNLKIVNVTEDEENYYVDYTYKTIAIKDNAWQKVLREKTLTVSKEDLGEEDLGLYVIEELGEEADFELNYLKEVQEIEREQGVKKVVTSVEYTGLKGLVLDIKEKALPGYKPLVEEIKKPEILGFYQPSPPSLSPPLNSPSQPQPQSQPSSHNTQPLSQGEIRSIVIGEMSQYLAGQETASTGDSSQGEESLEALEARLLREDGPLQGIFKTLKTEQERQERTEALKDQIDRLWDMLQQLKEMEKKY